MARARALALLLGALVCCARSEHVFIQAPPHQGEATLILVVRPDQGDPSAHIIALDADTRWTIRANLQRSSKLDVVALLYGCASTVLGLSEGSYGTTASGQGRPFPGGAKKLASTYDGITQSPWSEVQSDPDWFSGLELEEPDPDPCTAFSANTFAIEGSHTEPPFLIVLTSSVVLVGDHDGHAFTVDRGGKSHLRWQLFPPISSAFQRADGEIWFFQPPACLFKARGAAMPEKVSCSPYPMTAHRSWSSGAPSGPVDLFVLGEDNTLLHYDGVSWTRLLGAARDNATNQKSGLAWVGPNEAVAAGILVSSVIRAKNGTTSMELVDINGFDSLSTAGTTWGLGTLVGSNFGLLFRDQGGSWVQITHSGTNEMRAVAPLDDGAIITGQTGFFGVVRPGLKRNGEAKACPIVMYASGVVHELVPIGNDMVAGFDNGGPTELVFLNRTGPLKACPP